jgi:hypothetical protein
MRKGDLSLDYFIKLLQETKSVCSITGVALDTSFTSPEEGRYSLFKPSADRISSEKGYVEGNVHMIS